MNLAVIEADYVGNLQAAFQRVTKEMRFFPSKSACTTSVDHALLLEWKEDGSSQL